MNRDRIEKAAGHLRKLGFGGRFGVILGSGLGGMTGEFEERLAEPYSSIPGFLESTVSGHEGTMTQLSTDGVDLVAMKGRFHYYEGHQPVDLAIPVAVLQALGVEILFVTNAAGAMRPEFDIGDFLIIRDHINWSGANPLYGLPDPPGGGSRFVDMADAYSPELRKLAKKVRPGGMVLREGVLACFSGPSYETPAEVAAVRTLGGDVASMSTVPETLAARYLGMEVFAISCITNHAAGVGAEDPGHEAVLEASQKGARNLGRLVKSMILEKS